MKTPSPSQPGSALLVVLVITGVLVLLVLSALISAQIHHQAATNRLEDAKAAQLAAIAVDLAAEKVSRIPIDTHWASAPGRLRIWNGTNWDTVNLYSEGDGSDRVNLNTQNPDGTYPVISPNQEYPIAPEMPVDWIYVLSDGSFLPPGAPLPQSGVVGRIAYWTDIENARVNINTAGLAMINLEGHTLEEYLDELVESDASASNYRARVWEANPWMTDRVGSSIEEDGRLEFSPASPSDFRRRTMQNLTAHPSSVDLSVLEDVTEEDSLNTFRYAGSYFLRADALAMLRRLSTVGEVYEAPDLAASVDRSVRNFANPAAWSLVVGRATAEKNKQYITTMGRSPELTPWGFPKQALTIRRHDSNPLNILSESTVRADQRSLDNQRQDSRMLRIPARIPVRGSDPVTGDLRETALAGGPLGIGDGESGRLRFQNILAKIHSHLSAPLPEYTGSLAEKFNATSPGESEQISHEILAFLDATTNANALGDTRFLRTSPPPNTSDRYLFSAGLLGVQFANSDTRRFGSVGSQFLLNEIAMQVEGRRLLTNNTYSSITNPPAINRLNQLTPKPWVGMSNVSPSSDHIASAIIALRNRPDLPAPALQDERWLLIVVDAEVLSPPNWGLRRPRKFGNERNLYMSDMVLEWNTDDPELPADLRNSSVRLNALGSRFELASMHDPRSGIAFSSFPYSFAANQLFTVLPRIGDSRIWVGPFSPGSTVSLKAHCRFLLTNFLWGIPGGMVVAGRPGQAINVAQYPGIFPDYDPGGIITYTSGGNAQISPVGDVIQRKDSGDPSQVNLLEFDLGDFYFPEASTGAPLSPFLRSVSLEVDDPRAASTGERWQAAPVSSLGAQNYAFTGGNGTDASDLSRPNAVFQTIRGVVRSRFLDGSYGDSSDRSEKMSASKILGLPGVGYLSSIPTGVDAGIPWQTMNFGPTSGETPDWLVWSLFHVPYDRSIANNTDGKININGGTLHPFGIQRRKPLEALLGKRISNPSVVAQNIINRTLASGAVSLVGPPEMYIYPGQMCQIAGVADASRGGNEYEREGLVRDIADLVSTQSSDFRVFAIAQTLQQTPDGALVPGATKRLEAVLSRVPDQLFAFTGYALPTDHFVVQRQSWNNWLSGGPAPARLQVNTFTAGEVAQFGFSTTGLDALPNTNDDFLIPQKIQISNLQTQP